MRVVYDKEHMNPKIQSMFVGGGHDFGKELVSKLVGNY